MTLATITAAVCTLTACGGGGGDNDTTAGENSTGTGNTVALRYEVFPLASDEDGVLSLFNQEGAKGYRYLSKGRFDDIPVNYGSDKRRADDKSIFINDETASSYDYKLLPFPGHGNVADTVKQANAEGANGYRFEEFDSFTQSNPYRFSSYTLYSKATNSTDTYTYAADTLPKSSGINDIIAQMNTRGQSGYVYYANFPLYDSPDEFNFYEKNNSSNARYVYEAQPAVLTEKEMLAQLNSEGARGYRPRTSAIYENYRNTYNIYIKDQTQSATFTWVSEPAQSDNASFIAQANRGHKVMPISALLPPKSMAHTPKRYHFIPRQAIAAATCAGDDTELSGASRASPTGRASPGPTGCFLSRPLHAPKSTGGVPSACVAAHKTISGSFTCGKLPGSPCCTNCYAARFRARSHT